MIIPASIRNNNPGAAYPGPSSRKFGSSSFETLKSKDGVHKIATFPSSIQGAAALFDLLSSPAYTGRTIEQAITKWCGSFYVSTYIKVLEAQGGVSRSDMLTAELLRDPAKAIPLAKAMAQQEAGREYPMTDEEWAQAHACAFQQPIAPAFAPDNDVPSPRPETRTAAAISSAAPAVGVVSVGASGATALATVDLSSVAAKATELKAAGDAIAALGGLLMSSQMWLAALVGGICYFALTYVPKLIGRVTS